MLQFDHGCSSIISSSSSNSSKPDTKRAISFTCHGEEIELSSKISYSDDVSTSTTTYESRKKQVQFEIDPKDSEKVCCHFYSPTFELSRREVRLQWYRSTEIKEMRRVVLSEALAARESTSYIQHFEELHSCCGKNLSVELQPHHLALIVAVSPYRGCEPYIFLDLLRSKQKNIVHEVLFTQEYYFGTSQQLIKKLHSVSTNLSERSRRLAHIVATGDATVASDLVSSSERKIAALSGNTGSQIRKEHFYTSASITPANYERSNELIGSSTYEV